MENKVVPTAFCPTFHKAVELIGKRWSGAIIRAMRSGRVRFSDISDAVPGLHDRPVGCLFSPRCAYATPACNDRPELRQWQDGLVRCHYPFGDPAREDNRARDLKVVAA